MKHIANRILGKLPLCALMILLQFGWMVYVLYYATAISNAFNILLHGLSVLLALFVVNKDMKPYYKLSWIFLILCLPIFGCICYYLFGRSGLTKKKRLQLEAVMEELAPYRVAETEVLEALYRDNIKAGKQSEYIMNFSGYPPFREETTKYFSCGEDMFPVLLEDLRRAEHYIFLEYFIIQPGKMFDSILDILEQKTAQGVDVRVIYDDIGSIQTLPPKYYETLQQKGIRCACFNPFRPILSVVMNNRDHRKILVVDGKIAYTGGVNLADEYINEKERFGYWKDAAIRVTGSCAWSFATMFLEMWNYIVSGHEDYDYGAFLPEKISEASDDAILWAGFVQPFSDSPLDREDVSENVYLNIINKAEKYVYIFTPYLIISWEMSRALVNAAKCGVDVRIITPGIPDKKLVYLLTQANYESLIRGGVRIYQYTPGFLHSKCIVSDDVYAVVGSINLDFRSFYLHFECGTYLYKAQAVAQVKEDVEQTIAKSREISLEECENKNFFLQLLLSILHLFAPLL